MTEVKKYSYKTVRASTQPHPGVILKNEWMPKIPLTNAELSRAVEHSEALITRLTKGDRDITLQLARKLAKIFDNDHHYWLDLQIAYDEGIIEG